MINVFVDILKPCIMVEVTMKIVSINVDVKTLE